MVNNLCEQIGSDIFYRLFGDTNLSELQVEIVNGGIINRVNNSFDSVFRIKVGNEKYILKVCNRLENIITYYKSVCDSKGIDSHNIKDVLRFLSFLPGLKEYEVYKYFSEVKCDNIPQINSLVVDENKSKSFILMEDLQDKHFYDYQNPTSIPTNTIECAINAIVQIHNLFFKHTTYNTIEEITTISGIDFTANSDYFYSASQYLAEKFILCLPQKFINILHELVPLITNAFTTIDTTYKSLTHNDFNLRNTCYSPDIIEISCSIFDWDLCSIQNPVYDIVEYLIFLDKPLKEDTFQHFLLKYYKESVVYNNLEEYYRVITANIYWFIASKWCTYAVLDDTNIPFLSRLAINVITYLDYVNHLY